MSEQRQASRVVGVDIGGTKIAAGLVDRDGDVHSGARVPTPDGGADAVLDTVAELVAEVSSGLSVAAIGVAAPGIIEPDTGVVASATAIVPGWVGARVRPGLTERTGAEVAVDNDVRVMALGESAVGNAPGARDVLHVSVGTGIGGAFLRDGRLVRGARGTAGEIAHLQAPSAGRIPCGCGHYDHVEAIAAGPAIAAEYAARRSDVSVPELPEVVRRMRAGDAEAATVIREAATALGRCLSGVVTACDVDAIVLGGGVAQIGDDFVGPLETAVRADTRPPGREVPVYPAVLGTDAPVIGAGLLAWQSSILTDGGDQ